MLLGYNTNGLAHHDPASGLRLLAEIGYRSVAITIDHYWCNPFAPDAKSQAEWMRRMLRELNLRSVVETGARFLLDPRRKHEPTLVSASPSERARRLEFLKRGVELAEYLHSDCVSLWSGAAADDPPEAEIWHRLIPPLKELAEYADRRGVDIGFEPEPGMFVDTMDRFASLQKQADSQSVKLTLDIGHLHCQGETPLVDYIRRWSSLLVNVHLEDMRRGIHEHLLFGQGEIDFPPVIAALADIGYTGGVHVELSRHSHMAPDAARQAYDFLRPLWPAAA